MARPAGIRVAVEAGNPAKRDDPDAGRRAGWIDETSPDQSMGDRRILVRDAVAAQALDEDRAGDLACLVRRDAWRRLIRRFQPAVGVHQISLETRL